MTHKHNDGSDLPSFKCHTCGECCRHIHLVKELSHLHNGDGICVHLKTQSAKFITIDQMYVITQNYTNK